MIIKRKLFSKLCFACFLFFLLLINITSVSIQRSFAASNVNIEIDQLNEQIKQQQEKIKDIEAQKKLYQDRIDAARQQSTSLKNQISILDNQVAKTKIEINEKEAQIQETELIIRNLQLKIQNQRQEIENIKTQITKLIQTLDRYDNKGQLELILLNNSVSDFLDQTKYIENLQSNLQTNLEKIKLIKAGLEDQETNYQNKKEELTTLQNDLTTQKKQLSFERGTKTNLLTETRGAEWKFQTLLADAIREQKQAEADIYNTERLIRTKLQQQQEKKLLEQLNEGNGPTILSWPVPQDIITTSFHDPDYPFKRLLGEHPAIDIRASQGTPVRATAAGYVGKVTNGGATGYSYVMLIHNNGLATVYGHLSEIYVEQDTFVQRGKVIGRSGGIPGTPGAGRFCTGPHLHFEVRLNGIPVNPLDYLI